MAKPAQAASIESDGGRRYESGIYPKSVPTAFADQRESDDLLQQIARLAPHHFVRLSQLRRQRARLLQRSERLFLYGRGVDRETLNALCRAYQQQLDAFDAAEIALVQDALLTDIGVGD